MSEPAPNPEVDRQLVRQIARWALVVTLLMALYVVAILASWPFPIDVDLLRGAFYVLIGLALLVACLGITFLGYRIVTMRVAPRSRALYLIFLPGVMLVSGVVGFLLLTAPR